MRLGPTEQGRLLVFQVAELARRHRALGVPLDAPEAIALACDEMHLAARLGGTFDDVMSAGMAAVAPDDLLPGVAALVAEIRVEVVLDEGSRLIVLRGLGAPAIADIDEPGAVVVGPGSIEINAGMVGFELEVTNDSDHPVRVSSHYPFERVNARLRFDRAAARGARLDLPAGDTLRWEPGETRIVRLVRAGEDST